MNATHQHLHRSLLIGSISVFVLLSLYAVYILEESYTIQERLINDFISQTAKTRSATDMQIRAYERSDLLYAMLLEEDPFLRDSIYLKFEKSGQRVADARLRFNDFSLNEAEERALDNQQTNIQQTEEDQETIVDLLQRDEIQQAHKHMRNSTSEIQGRVNHNFEVIRQLQYEAISQSIAQAQKQLKDTLIGFGILLIMIAVICIFIAIRMYRTVTGLAGALFEKNAQLDYEATHDALTQTYNRRYLNEQIKNKLETQKYNDFIFSIDLDNFKAINDKHGHSTGDRYLIKISELLNGAISDNGVLARYGGDEFIALVNAESDPAKVAEKMLAIRDLKLVIDNCSTNITMSIGIVEITAELTSIDRVFSKVDQAMYSAKNSGKNQYVIA